MRTLLLLTLLGALSACSSSSSQQFVPMPDLGVEISNPAMARVYLLRESGGIGFQWPVDAYRNQHYVGRLEPGGYLCFEREPGSRVARLVTVKRTEDGLGSKEHFLDGTLGAGEVVYAAVHIDHESWRPVVEILGAKQGRARIAQLEPAQVVLE